MAGTSKLSLANAIRFARERGRTLHLVQGDHRLNARIPLLPKLFDAFLLRCQERA